MIPAITNDIGGLAASLGALMSITTESAGWLLGGLLSGVWVAVALMLMSKLESSSPIPLMFFAGLGIGMATLFGWFPIFMLFFTFVFALASVVGLMAAGRGGP